MNPSLKSKSHVSARNQFRGNAQILRIIHGCERKLSLVFTALAALKILGPWRSTARSTVVDHAALTPYYSRTIEP